MRILWLCNIMLPMIAENLHMEASNKEGWLSGLAGTVLERSGENAIELAVAFPTNKELSGPEKHIYDGAVIYKGRAESEKGAINWYGFWEDTTAPHVYDEKLEFAMYYIVRDFQPDVVHCFGTEYPHTLAMCRTFPDKMRLLVGIQGLCKVCANAYFSNMPKSVLHRVTLRDFLKRDSLRKQREKFARRGEMEYEAITLAGNVTGRTAWDKHYTGQWNPNAKYFEMNETLRPEFYEGKWEAEKCERNSIFLSQGDYPIKGMHYMLLALPAIRKAVGDVQAYVAGDDITGEGSFKKRLKLSGYGAYLRSLIRRYGLQDCVHFLGRLDAGQMKERYLKSNVFVCCSTVENSPNSLGEAMLLGVPCVAADVGGIGSIFTDKKDGILYEGFKSSENSFDNACDLKSDAEELQKISKNLSNAVIEILLNHDFANMYSENARKHARKTHDKEQNYQKMTEIYAKIASSEKTSEKFVFVSNYINHHQIPFCNAMYEKTEGAFVFIQTQPMEEERVRMGWQEQENLPYVRYYYEEPEVCSRLIAAAPVVIFGGVDDESYIAERLQRGRPVLRYMERLYKEGQWKAISPRGLIKKYKDHTRYRRSPVYLLCAGAYVPSDFHLIHAYPGKMLKWGYFPETKHYDRDRLMEEKQPGTILWAARFLDWKHPETALQCARHLKQKGYSFHMNIVGGGQMQPMVDRLMQEYGLSDVVSLLGYRTPGEVRKLMEQSDIYLATSDRREGWGAVLNEAMNSGCAVVADHMMGAAPFLIRQGENGFLYRDGRPEQLFEKVERLLEDRELCGRLGRAAMETIESLWNAETAAERLIHFCDTHEPAEEGPGSVAPVISERKMLCKIL